MACDIFLNRLIVLSFLLLWGQLLKDNNEPFYRQTRKTSLTTFTERGFLTRIKQVICLPTIHTRLFWKKSISEQLYFLHLLTK